MKGAIHLLEVAWQQGLVVNDEACATVVLAVERFCACVRFTHRCRG